LSGPFIEVTADAADYPRNSPGDVVTRRTIPDAARIWRICVLLFPLSVVRQISKNLLHLKDSGCIIFLPTKVRSKTIRQPAQFRFTRSALASNRQLRFIEAADCFYL